MRWLPTFHIPPRELKVLLLVDSMRFKPTAYCNATKHNNASSIGHFIFWILPPLTSPPLPPHFSFLPQNCSVWILLRKPKKHLCLILRQKLVISHHKKCLALVSSCLWPSSYPSSYTLTPTLPPLHSPAPAPASVSLPLSPHPPRQHSNLTSLPFQFRPIPPSTPPLLHPLPTGA